MADENAGQAPPSPTVFLSDPDVTLWHGDVRETLAQLEAGSVDCVVTSPPYWGLRDYGTGVWVGGDPECEHERGKDNTTPMMGHRNETERKFRSSRYLNQGDAPVDVCRRCGAVRGDQQLGLEPTPELYIENMVGVFREVWRVLADHGTCWVNMGDSYAANRSYQVADQKWKNAGRSVAGTEEAREEAQQWLGRVMTKADAEEVKEIYADEYCTWRGLATAFGDRHGYDWTGNQLAGMALWEAAQHILDEWWDEGERALPVQRPRAAEVPAGLKPKDLVGVPWKLAFALQADGWYLRSDIVWSKPNPMPESVTDRPTKAHEYVFLLAKRPRYFFDQEAVRERSEDKAGRVIPDGWNGSWPSGNMTEGKQAGLRDSAHFEGCHPAGRNIRSVWEIATQPYPEAHFATFPEELARRCILAGCPEWVCGVCGKPRERIIETSQSGRKPYRQYENEKYDGKDAGFSTHPGIGRADIATQTVGWSDCGHGNYRPGRVLDPFVGSGTVPHVARKHGRHAIGIDLNGDYLKLAGKRLQQLSLLSEVNL